MPFLPRDTLHSAELDYVIVSRPSFCLFVTLVFPDDTVLNFVENNYTYRVFATGYRGNRLPNAIITKFQVE